MVHALRYPDYFTITDSDGTIYRGGDQLWYADYWQRRAGCGPVAAAVLLSYLASTRWELAKLAPAHPRTMEGFLPFLEEVWQYVTPGSRGLDKPESFLIGCRSFALSKGTRLNGDILSLPHRTGGEKRPSLAWCREFILSALDDNCPLAFLNFSSGEAEGLDDWHWVPVIAAAEENDRLYLLLLDEGKEKAIDFNLWWSTSLEGGALVSLTPEKAPSPYTLTTRTEGEDVLCRLTGGGTPMEVRLCHTPPALHWLVSWPCVLPEGPAVTLTGLTLPHGDGNREQCRALLTFAIQTAREQGGGALRLSLPPEEAELATLCEGLGFLPAQAKKRAETTLCFLEKEL